MKNLTKIAFCLLASGILAMPAGAATMNWGQIADPNGTVVFDDVGEENMLSDLVYVPAGQSPTAMGDSLQFDPSLFIAAVDAQGQAGSEIIDSEVAFTITARDGYTIDSFTVGEAGSATLSGGLIGGMAGASVEATVNITGAVVDGVFVDMTGTFAPYSATNGGTFTLPADQGTTQWSGSSTYDASVLSGDVTWLSVVIDNTLTAEADVLGSSYIDKKEFSVTVTTSGSDPVVPEPTAAAMAVLAGIAGCFRRR